MTRSRGIFIAGCFALSTSIALQRFFRESLPDSVAGLLMGISIGLLLISLLKLCAARGTT